MEQGKKGERLQKFIARCGSASRRKAEELIREGRVAVNGVISREMGQVIDPAIQRVEIDGKAISPPEGFVYYALYKPQGVVCTLKDPHAETKVTDLVPAVPRVFPVGRLDRESEGLIILTNDGDLTLKLTHPGFRHEKEYRVTARPLNPEESHLTANRAMSLSRGMILENGEKTQPCVVTVEETDKDCVVFRIILKEGKKRQIRRMCRVAGLVVNKLIRTRTGKISLNRLKLKPGEYALLKIGDII